MSPPSGVVRFFNKTTLFWLNLTQEPSFFKVSFLVLIIMPLYLDFFFIQFSGCVNLTLILTKSPINDFFLKEPLYK